MAKAEEDYVLLENLVTILVALDMLGQIDYFLPPQYYSPIQIFKIQGKKRKRASKVHHKGGVQNNDNVGIDW